ncbi:MarR family winged helix-turn-helix transcriptional regulator [Mesoplasma lactucae]|uniref:Uncharacterized protein n=1 Tax=Mesoplasma lactucae ATCC 49193 TaxID=81460 RepID=A0A291IQZ4_9MOLU|nr:MarR family transcriptional regulator [Mesoplasma lactucae]ATG97282.1 hypothetical protein CP520_00720 [Mesoplasma lactucae ATCC 49193]ATZ20268.1 hypothetical protein MLACT_v1c04470 [Mesoplasma lactucae ATCC 49193]MCL8216439.1 hypothetical protein [Mesoplasma lactucae ATCC 49193]
MEKKITKNDVILTVIQSRAVLTNLRDYLVEHAKTINVNIKPEQIFLLLALGYFDDLTQEKIASYYGYDRATTSRVLTRLSDVGAIEITIDQHDKRKKHLDLTKKGKAAYEELKNLLYKWYEGFDTNNELDESLKEGVKNLHDKLNIEGK